MCFTMYLGEIERGKDSFSMTLPRTRLILLLLTTGFAEPSLYPKFSIFNFFFTKC